MATQPFADEEFARLREFPEVSREELFQVLHAGPVRCRVHRAGAGRGPTDRLGPAVALCTLPWFGSCRTSGRRAAGGGAAGRAAEVDASLIRSYGRRAQTRIAHLRLVARYAVCTHWATYGAPRATTAPGCEHGAYHPFCRLSVLIGSRSIRSPCRTSSDPPSPARSGGVLICRGSR